MDRATLHLILHFLLPLLIAKYYYPNRWRQAYLVLISTMLVDLDHLLANPIYDPGRCSIGFHPLHSYYLQPFYVLLTILPKTRLVGLGLTLHMSLDAIDCIWMKSLS